MNKYQHPFYFLKPHIYFIYLKIIILINKTISSYLFNYKNLITFLKFYIFLIKIVFNIFYEKQGVTHFTFCTTDDLS